MIEREEDVKRKAMLAAPLLVKSISAITLDFYKGDITQFWLGDEEELQVRIVLSDVIFHLHVIDRFVFGILGEEQRAIYMDTLLLAVRDILASPFETEEEKEQFEDEFREAYNKAQMTYGRYARTIPEQSGDPPKDTLFWEFAKMRAKEIGIINPAEFVMINVHNMDVSIALVKMLREVNIFW